MNRQRKIDALNRALHGSANSVLQYIEIATPYVPADFEEQYEAILQMRDEEVATAHALTDMVNELDGVPKVGVFPYWNVDLNYLDIRFMARLCAEDIGKAIAAFEGEIGDLRNDARVHGLLARVLEEKKRHRAALAEIAGVAAPAESAE